MDQKPLAEHCGCIGPGDFHQEDKVDRSACRYNPPRPLFRLGDFALHSGQKSRWKIDCDAFTNQDWSTLAMLIAEQVRFSEVVGVPSGGLKLAAALREYKSDDGPMLVVDDVLTTGGSILAEMDKYGAATGFVAFARGPLPIGVQAVFSSCYNLAAQRAAEELVSEVVSIVKANGMVYGVSGEQMADLVDKACIYRRAAGLEE